MFPDFVWKRGVHLIRGCVLSWGNYCSCNVQREFHGCPHCAAFTLTNRACFQVYPEDNLIAVGKVHGDFCNLEFYLYNEQDENLYCHHDILLGSFPLALEWLDYDPGDAAPGNLVAMGTMQPDIEIWDVDVIDSIEPAYVLQGTYLTKSSAATLCVRRPPPGQHFENMTLWRMKSMMTPPPLPCGEWRCGLSPPPPGQHERMLANLPCSLAGRRQQTEQGTL